MTFKLPLLTTKEALSDDTPSVLALFGIQHPESLTPLKRNSIAALKDIFALENGPGHVQIMTEAQQPRNPSSNCNTTIFQAFWFSSTDYEAWWQSAAVSSFWNSLEEDAGIWREIMRINPRRFMHATGSTKKQGLALVPELAEVEYADIAPQQKYWGIYRERIPDHESDDFESAFISQAQRKEMEEKEIRLGRVVLLHGIDNMLYVWEFQDYSQMTEQEKEIWDKHINPFVRGWMDSLDKERSKHGVLSFRNTALTQIDDDLTSTLPESRITSQFVFYLDLAAFEYSGKSTRDHFKARMAFEKHHKSSGTLGMGKGRTQLSVEVGILKRSDFEAEYIGCLDGTGLMGYKELTDAA
ncbi:hem-containing dehydratase domain-containing protein [Trichoderma breve]|uniref:Hem-containing dehydratase domain-containing protein n=1 Tax=Trichoderma breve TaxID=2034170 RepID=A0A9W9EAU0_9HYPO|nr:hem-containing dehydratase domain-containing protein [Trichoderma breve]KAJ4863269.1 hem-containing dehydratase domain-containing protein [Trichoderma breve]